MQPWQIVDSFTTEDGVFELRRRAADDYLITLDGRVLMNSRARRSEVALAEVACAELAGARAPRVLIGGLGMGCTLRAALDHLPADAAVEVAELNRRVVEWGSTELASVNGHALADRRCAIHAENVLETLARAGGRPAYHAVIFDLYEGPGGDSDPLFGRRALRTIRAVLKPRGVFAAWSEGASPGFEKRLSREGFDCARRRFGRAGLRHVVYLARPRSRAS